MVNGAVSWDHVPIWGADQGAQCGNFNLLRNFRGNPIPLCPSSHRRLRLWWNLEYHWFSDQKWMLQFWFNYSVAAFTQLFLFAQRGPSYPSCIPASRIKKNTMKMNTLGIWTEYIKLWECDIPGTCSSKLAGTECLHCARSGYVRGMRHWATWCWPMEPTSDQEDH